MNSSIVFICLSNSFIFAVNADGSLAVGITSASYLLLDNVHPADFAAIDIYLLGLFHLSYQILFNLISLDIGERTTACPYKLL